MNKITKLGLAFLATISLNSLKAQVTLPISFEAPGVTYTMIDFDGGTTSLLANPSSSGINTSSASLRMVKNAGQPWGGSKITLASAIDFSSNNTFKMKVYSPRVNCPVLFKIEAVGGAFVERTAYTTAINTWEELSWDFTGAASNTYTDLVFIYDLGVMGDGSSNFTFFQDDIRLVNQVSSQSQINLPVTFDLSTVNYTVTDFGGNSTVLGADPTNASNMVAITTKTSGAELWAGTTIGTNAGFASVIPFTATNHKMQVRVYSPDAGIPVRLKAEIHGQPTMSVETEATTTVANSWETLVFNFDNQASGTATFNSGYAYDMASIFFNFGTTGATAGAKTYYFDDVAIYGSASVLSQINLPVTFDATTVDYTVTDFGGNSSVLGADPTNASNMVAITTKTSGAELWAGTTIGTNAGFASVIPFTASNHKMQVRVYSPNANIPVRLKVEVHGQPTMSVETEAMTTVANAWETLVFNFDNQASGTAAFNTGYAYDMASIFFNFGTTGAIAGAKTYYFDDVAIYDATVNINKINTDGILSIYPNPATSNIHVNVNTNVNYKIVDLTGRTVLTGKMDNNSINVNNLSNGIYELQLNTETGIVNKRFVKE